METESAIRDRHHTQVLDLIRVKSLHTIILVGSELRLQSCRREIKVSPPSSCFTSLYQSMTTSPSEIPPLRIRPRKGQSLTISRYDQPVFCGVFVRALPTCLAQTNCIRASTNVIRPPIRVCMSIDQRFYAWAMPDSPPGRMDLFSFDDSPPSYVNAAVVIF